MINFKEDENLNKLNHSCAHLMAQAISHLYPEAKFWVGPVVESGFYYDVDLGDKVINDEDIGGRSRGTRDVNDKVHRMNRELLWLSEIKEPV